MSDEQTPGSDEEGLSEDAGARAGEHKIIWLVVFGLLVVTLLLAML